MSLEHAAIVLYTTLGSEVESVKDGSEHEQPQGNTMTQPLLNKRQKAFIKRVEVKWSRSNKWVHMIHSNEDSQSDKEKPHSNERTNMRGC